jgi:hypothetical protein
VLDTMETGVEKDGRLSDTSYLELMRTNLDALYSALRTAK